MASVEMNWRGNMLFYSRTSSGHDVFMDSSPEVGGNNSAARPMEYFILSLAGCTGMDVVSILSKMKLLDKIKSFDIKIEFGRAETHPKVYKWIKVLYVFKVEKGTPHDKIKRAVELSQDKYCSVSAMLKKAVEDFGYEVIIKEAP
ncbi:MAG: OsmC family protein [Thermotogaceae bacterium]|nr:OsmC family protein [Thermotogaceae bacterium]